MIVDCVDCEEIASQSSANLVGGDIHVSEGPTGMNVITRCEVSLNFEIGYKSSCANTRRLKMAKECFFSFLFFAK